jgi:hypothetical protein
MLELEANHAFHPRVEDGFPNLSVVGLCTMPPHGQWAWINIRMVEPIVGGRRCVRLRRVRLPKYGFVASDKIIVALAPRASATARGVAETVPGVVAEHRDNREHGQDNDA